MRQTTRKTRRPKVNNSAKTLLPKWICWQIIFGAESLSINSKRKKINNCSHKLFVVWTQRDKSKLQSKAWNCIKIKLTWQNLTTITLLSHINRTSSYCSNYQQCTVWITCTSAEKSNCMVAQSMNKQQMVTSEMTSYGA